MFFRIEFISAKIYAIIALTFFIQFILSNISSKIRIFVDHDNALAIKKGVKFSIYCQYPIDSIAWWTFNDANLSDFKSELSEKKSDDENVIIFTKNEADLSDSGKYNCNVLITNETISENILINVIKPLKVLFKSETQKVKIYQNVCLFCSISGSGIHNVYWTKDVNNNDYRLEEIVNKNFSNKDIFNMTICLNDLNQKSNGTYKCHVTNIYNDSEFDSINLLIMSSPIVNFDFAKAVTSDSIYLNWTVNDGNDWENLNFTIKYKKIESSEWILLTKSNNFSNYLLKNLEKDTEYILAIYGKNSAGVGYSSTFPKNIRTLKNDPVFVPEIFFKGSTVSSITVKWNNISDDLNDLIHTFQLHATDQNNTIIEYTQSIDKPNIYWLTNLKPATTYFFKVKACSKYTNQCGPWSPVINGTTLEGISGPPINLTLSCVYNNNTKSSEITATWLPPKNPNGKVFNYNVILDGVSTYRDETGNIVTVKDVNLIKNIDANTQSNRFVNVPVNTNYTVKVVVVSKTKKYGEESQASCKIPTTFPDETELNKVIWETNILNNKAVFHLTIPRISERSAQICCYRIYLIRLKDDQNLDDLPAPVQLEIRTYHEAYNLRSGAVYLAEMFSSENFQESINLGDNKIIRSSNNECLTCAKLLLNENNSDKMNRESELRRNRISKTYTPYDGDLDINANYTGYLEIIYKNADEISMSSMFSNYFRILKPGQHSDIPIISPMMYGMFFQAFILAVFVLFVLLISFCFIHRYSKKIVNSQGVELITFRSSFGNLCRSLRGRRKLISSWPREMRSIPKDNLLNVYLEKHRDSDYEFQREFEMLPEKFSNRSTRASEARENLSKNRYPDIKAYDQTRVRLSQIDSVSGSDYINANFVNGYKDRKRFICAQGPLESTIYDFWRMIWEQKIEVILMLTNLEEYSKVKCAKYWPGSNEKEALYNDFCIIFVNEKMFSDYVVRELKIVKQIPNNEKIERKITQFHFTSWKDFNAPDYPSTIVKFIRRINEVYTPDRGSILVHCSAGVGRTGTLVALDSLSQELNEDNCVSIFGTVCELRQQRNLLVQSLKQYIFVYRALLEIILYGNTEINVNELKDIYRKLIELDPKSKKCLMELEFEKILKIEMKSKSLSIALDNENIDKNRNDDILPYNSNRVILMPESGLSTYINASFIEGYYSQECYVITQDPIENKTEHDFWRMIFNHNVSIIVMLSELGDGYKRCPKYWPDDFAQYGNLTVQYIQSENCPYFTKREFRVTNCLTSETAIVSHFQYNGWPTVDGEVPEVTRGLLELIDQTLMLCDQLTSDSSIVVHCHFGTDRSSMFVGLSILIQQLKIERRIDVFNVVRKLRSQRPQYEFLYRAINNYADLHKLTSDS